MPSIEWNTPSGRAWEGKPNSEMTPSMSTSSSGLDGCSVGAPPDASTGVRPGAARAAADVSAPVGAEDEQAS